MTMTAEMTPDMTLTDAQYQRRFAGTQKLYGAAQFSKFENLHAYVVGVGGVGSVSYTHLRAHET